MGFRRRLVENSFGSTGQAVFDLVQVAASDDRSEAASNLGMKVGRNLLFAAISTNPVGASIVSTYKTTKKTVKAAEWIYNKVFTIRINA